MIPLLEENGELSTGAASKSWIFVIVIVCLFLIAPFLSANCLLQQNHLQSLLKNEMRLHPINFISGLGKDFQLNFFRGTW